MLFVFYILVFSIINYPRTYCFVLRNNDERIKRYTKIDDLHGEDDLQNKTNVATDKQLFKILQNLTNAKNSNLKSNVFDKMLSDEMLSIKRYFYEKDLSQVLLQLTDKVSVATPTLEIKQKWPRTQDNYTKVYEDIKHNLIKSELMMEQSGDNTIDVNKTLIANSIVTDVTSVQKLAKPHDKILGYRSLPEIAPGPVYRISHNPSSTKLCTCMKTNPSTTCTHRCTGSTGSTKCCTRSVISNTGHQCTHTMTSYTTYPNLYVTYPYYFLGMSPIKPYKKYYYPANLIGDLKVPTKSKPKKTTKYYDSEELYYDYTTKKDYTDSYVDELENYKTTKKRTYNGDVIMHIECGDKVPEPILPNKKQERLVNQVVNDLKLFYNDAAIKDCYCTSMSVHIERSYFCALLIFVASCINNIHSF